MHHALRSQRGFTFIETLVVMAIIAVLAGMVVTIIPYMIERANQTKSKDNVAQMVKLMLSRRAEGKGWPRYNGKNFLLSLVATGQIDPRNVHNLELLYSPGDELYKLELVERERYMALTTADLRNDADNHDLSSYAGRLNGEREHLITPDQEKRGTIVICDDDDGHLHHSDGLVIGYSNGAARFLLWDELGVMRPADPDNPEPFLADAATNEELRKLSSR